MLKTQQVWKHPFRPLHHCQTRDSETAAVLPIVCHSTLEYILIRILNYDKTDIRSIFVETIYVYMLYKRKFKSKLNMYLNFPFLKFRAIYFYYS